MKHILPLALAVSMAVAPVAAQTSNTEEAEDGLNLMEEGARMLLRGLMTEMEPGVNEFRDLMEEVGPQIGAMVETLGPRLEMMMELVDNFDNYGNPEILPNGDIIIRRNPEAPALEPAPEGEIEL